MDITWPRSEMCSKSFLMAASLVENVCTLGKQIRISGLFGDLT